MTKSASQWASPSFFYLYSLLVVVADVSHGCNDEGYDRHAANGANYDGHHVLF